MEQHGERPVLPEDPRGWRHGELYFEGTGTVTKFLVVPDHIDDPEQVLQVMLGSWGMPMPSMTISVHSAPGAPFTPLDSQLPPGHRLKDMHWSKFPQNWIGEVDVKKDEKDAQDAAKARFESKVTDMMYGVCRAAAESKGWIVSETGARCGGDLSGFVVDSGVNIFREYRQSQMARLINLAFHWKTCLVEDDDKGYGDTNCSMKWGPEGNGDPKVPEALRLKLTEDNAVPLDQRPKTQLVIKSNAALTPQQVESNNLHQFVLRQRATHIVFSHSTIKHRTKVLTEDLVPHVAVIVSGKHARKTWTSMACPKAQRGATVILLKNSGKVVDTICDAVEAKKKDPKAKTAGLEVPESVPLSNFLIFDALEDTPDDVIERLTSALAVVGGDEIREMGFAQTEKERLRYAWELCILFGHNAKLLRRTAWMCHVLVTLTAFLTTLCAVLLTASHEQQPVPDDAGGELISMNECRQHMEEGSLPLAASLAPADEETGVGGETLHLQEYIPLPMGVKALLALVCAVVPMVSAFLLSLSSKFSYTKRWMLMTVAHERVLSGALPCTLPTVYIYMAYRI